MATNHEPTAKAEATRKGVRKVNLNDLKGTMSKRGRARYVNPVLLDALREMLVDKEPICWDEAIVSGKTEKQVTASKAKWRQRAISVFEQLDADESVGISIGWTTENEMIITIKEAQ